MRLPELVMEFYQLGSSETSLSDDNDIALLTIEETVVPVELPATHSEEAACETGGGNHEGRTRRKRRGSTAGHRQITVSMKLKKGRPTRGLGIRRGDRSEE